MKGRFLPIITVMVCLAGYGLLQGCAQNDSLSDIGLLPVGHSSSLQHQRAKTSPAEMLFLNPWCFASAVLTRKLISRPFWISSEQLTSRSGFSRPGPEPTGW